VSEPIQFDRADYIEVSELACKLCSQPLQHQYFDMGGSTICSECRNKIEQGRSDNSGARRFVRAAGFGFVAAALGAVVYAVIVNLTGFEFGLMAVVLGYVIGKAVWVGSFQRGGWRYQALAMVLTYIAICMEYLPQVLKAGGHAYSAARIALAFAVSMLAPVLILLGEGLSGILGVVIIGIGLYEAWKLNRSRGADIAGPFPISPSKPPVEGSVTVGH
jgi:hypothetical protein